MWGRSEATDKVSFGLDGMSYEIDLSTENAAKLRTALAPYLKAAHKVGGQRKRGSASQTTTVDSDNATIRSWAQANGYQISSRGRVSAEVRKAFGEANK